MLPVGETALDWDQKLDWVPDMAGDELNSRAVAFDALTRIEQQGAYSNLVLDGVLQRSGLDQRDRAFVTQMVYGTTRMRRACDFLVDRYVLRKVDANVRTLLRLGAYQLHYMSTAPHAAVDATVEAAPRKARGFVNAVLRKVAGDDEVDWPSPGVELSYPDWIIERLENDIGRVDAHLALEMMNREPSVHERSDGYVQDPASGWVCDVVDPQPHDRILDCCAAPGGKATLLAASGADVVASDRRTNRARLVTKNAERTGRDVAVIVADAGVLPFADTSFDRVLVDAPCSGLGVLRRRADARWRIDQKGVARLAALQKRVLVDACRTVKVGGRLVYSVCTMTQVETTESASVVPDAFAPLPVTEMSDRWREHGHGGLIAPQDHDSDGMAVFAWMRTS